MKHDAGRNEKRPSVNTRGTYSRSAQPQEQLNYRSCDLRCQQFYLKNKTILAGDAGITELTEPTILQSRLQSALPFTVK
jgi:hypothetical protein